MMRSNPANLPLLYSWRCSFAGPTEMDAHLPPFAPIMVATRDMASGVGYAYKIAGDTCGHSINCLKDCRLRSGACVIKLPVSHGDP